MTARKLLRQPQALSRYPTLELIGKNRSSRPARTVVGTSGQRVSGKRVWNSESAGSSSRDDISSQDFRRQVMKEIGLRIETCIGIATLTQVVIPHGVSLAGVAPPFARRLSGRWDHGVEQHKFQTGSRSQDKGALKAPID